MANRFYSPDQQFLSNSGVPYAGGMLYFYATGTSTPLNTYSNQALTIANTNPVVLDSNGQAGSIFLQNLAYKVVLADVNNNQIWTMDPVYTSDYSAAAQFLPYAGNPNGFVAGVAGTTGALPYTSSVWDYTDNILYVCTTTGNAASAVWTAVNASSGTSTIPTPQGYLTANSDSSNPVPPTDVVSSTSIYYTPFVGNQIPVYNGSSFVTTSFTQLSLALSASQALNTIYDCFVFSNSGVLTLVTGPAWSVSTAGSGARGTGAGTTQLQRLNGLWVNAVQISGKNGSTTYTIPSNTATFVGSIYVDGTAGQVSCYRNVGQSRKWGVSNAYNREPVQLLVADPAASWTNAPTTWRESNGSTTNFATVFSCLPEEPTVSQFVQQISLNCQNNANAVNTGIGLNSATTPSGQYSFGSTAQTNITGDTHGQVVVATYTMPPTIGINNLNCLEQGTTGGNTNTFYGTSSKMQLSAAWRA